MKNKSIVFCSSTQCDYWNILLLSVFCETFSLAPLFMPFCQLFLQLCYILTGNCSLLNLLSIALSFSLLDDEHFNSTTAPKKKKGQEKKPRSMTTYLELLFWAVISGGIVTDFP